MLKLDTGPTYRLHLRIDDQGTGILIINASTILHLNHTAVEYAYHLIKETPLETITAGMMKRYQIDEESAEEDFQNFKTRLETLVATPDLDPETFLDIDRVDVHDQSSTAPMRLDCAVTYQVPGDGSSVYAPVDRVKRMLSTEEWKQILKNAWDAGIPHVVFTGGEPTLRPDIPELIKFTEELGQVTGLITDGSRLSETGYLHELLMAGLDHLMIVLNPSSDQSWEAVKDVIAEDIFLTVHLTLTRKNQPQFEKILEKLSKLQVKSLSLSAESSELWKVLPQFTQKAVESGFSLVWDMPVPYSAFNPIALELEQGDTRSKGAGTSWLYVEPDGDVLIGQGHPSVLGNFLTDPWLKIWAEAKIVRYG
jgi:organic radical activating enzyme